MNSSPTNSLSRKLQLYVFLTVLFSLIIAAANLTGRKIVAFYILNQEISISVALLFFPISFLISDLITEFFGKEYAYFTVKLAVLTNVLLALFLIPLNLLPANSWSPIDDKIFSAIFGVFDKAVLASLISVYISQVLDIYVFSYIKQNVSNLLWLRSFVSTILGQITDTAIVGFLYCLFNLMPCDKVTTVGVGNFLIKFLATTASIPILYSGKYFMNRFIYKAKD